jgi:ferredoxin
LASPSEIPWLRIKPDTRNMPKITFPSTGASFEVEAGASLLEFIQSNDTPIPLGCTSGACGTCIAVIECEDGALEPADEDELEMIEHSTDNPGARLCCLMKVSGDVSISTL